MQGLHYTRFQPKRLGRIKSNQRPTDSEAPESGLSDGRIREVRLDPARVRPARRPLETYGSTLPIRGIVAASYGDDSYDVWRLRPLVLAYPHDFLINILRY